MERAKCFQKITSTKTVMNKSLSFKKQMKKVSGTAYHLLLPIEQTFKKLCKETDVINLNHELYILVKSIPNSSKYVWQNLVDVHKVWKALLWYKNNNPLYSLIKLPKFSDGIAQILEHMPQTEFQDENDAEQNSEDVTSKQSNNQDHVPCDKGEQTTHDNAILTCASQSDAMYEQYTVFPIQSGRTTDSAIKLYQQKKVHDTLMPWYEKKLDMLCFPDIYPKGENGIPEDRSQSLRDCDYIKARVTSKHPRYRRNSQHLFDMMNNATMRQVNGGVYQTLNLTKGNQKFTKEIYLQRKQTEILMMEKIR